MRAFAFFIPFFLAAPAVHADVVRCTDANGNVSYTDGACPAGSRGTRQVPIMEPPPPEARGPEYVAPPPSAPSRLPAPVASNAPSGPAIIPRNAVADAAPAADPPPVYILGPEPYYDGSRRPIHRPPPRVRDPGPPPGERPCQNLAGIKRSNC